MLRHFLAYLFKGRNTSRGFTPKLAINKPVKISQEQKMDIAELTTEAYKAIKQKDIVQSVRYCSQLARFTNDHLYSFVFLSHLYDKPQHATQWLVDNLLNAPEDYLKLLTKKSNSIWLQTHTIDYGYRISNTGEPLNVVNFNVHQIEEQIISAQSSLTNLAKAPDADLVNGYTLQNDFYESKAELKNLLSGLIQVKNKILDLCFNYAVMIEKQLIQQKRSVNFLESVYEDVNSYFNLNSNDVYAKLMKASSLVYSDDAEDRSLLFTEVRRAIKSAADYFYPPSSRAVVCKDGKERSLGDDEYLNRLHEYIATEFSKSKSSQLLNAEFELLAAFMRKLDRIASKGVHAEVSLSEAKQGLIGLYFFLHNIISHKATS